MNEILRRALLRAQLSEDDIAAHLAVDPKTVRRWTEGRVPYLRHRWELARLLGCDETDLWPQLGTPRSVPEEVQAIYPQRDAVPSELWAAFFTEARQEIDILTSTAMFLSAQPGVERALCDRLRAGIRLRICVRDLEGLPLSAGMADAFPGQPASRKSNRAQIRLHRTAINNSIYRTDNELLVSQYAYGIPAGRSPVLYLRTAGDVVAAAYIASFEQIWSEARSIDTKRL